jgi:hypothetical protein
VRPPHTLPEQERAPPPNPNNSNKKTGDSCFWEGAPSPARGGGRWHARGRDGEGADGGAVSTARFSRHPLQSDERDLAEYENLRELAVNREVIAMEMTWAEKMEIEYTQKGVQRGLDALHRVVLRLLSQRFGTIPETLRRKVEAIDSMDSLSDLATRVHEVQSIDDMGL